MSQSKLKIINSALLLCRKSTIQESDLSEDKNVSENGMVILNNLNICIESLLSELPWKFAKREVFLQKLYITLDSPEMIEEFGFGIKDLEYRIYCQRYPFIYYKPENIISFLNYGFIYNGSNVVLSSVLDNYKSELDVLERGSYILSKFDNMYASVIVNDTEDTEFALWPPHFINAFIYLLASHICVSIGCQQNRHQFLIALYNSALEKAKKIELEVRARPGIIPERLDTEWFVNRNVNRNTIPQTSLISFNGNDII